jgi:predicted Zn-dependent protease
MVATARNQGHDIPLDEIAELTRLYELGLYVQAATRTASLPPVKDWRGTAAQLIAGRLANNLHAPHLARRLHTRAWREDRGNPEAAYYYALSIMNQRGPLATWKFLRRLPAFPDITLAVQTNFLSLRARIASNFRDFDTATQLLAEAEAHEADRPWLFVEKGWIHEQQDAYEEALASSRHALGLHPHFRPAVQSAAHQLQLLGRDEEALAFLSEESHVIESSSTVVQLATLQTELGLYRDALESWERVRTLAPWMEEKVIEWWEARVSDARYFFGDLAGAAEAAARSKNPWHEKLVERLQSPPPAARRVLLPVGFVRQHHFTCAPATLSALSRFWQMPVDHLGLAAQICYDGTPDHIERHWAEENGYHVREFRVTWPTLTALLDRGVPFTLTTVETQSAHLQAIIGYDSFRRTLLIRDPYERTHGEYSAEEFLERYAANGPRGMLLVPLAEQSRLDGIELPDAEFYDHHYRLQRALFAYDRPAAQQHYDAMETLDAAHRLTLQARRSLASYDGSLPRQLAAVEELLTRYPQNGNLRWAKLHALRELARREDYLAFLHSIASEKDSEPLFWRELAEELRSDARRQGDVHRLLLRGLRFRPLDPDHLHSLANLHWDRRQFAEATEFYRLATSLRDKVDFYARSYFIAARHLRQAEAALALLERRFAAYGPLSAQPTKLLFWALTVLDRQPVAFEKLEAALTLRPDDGDLLLYAADAFARHGDVPRGEALLGAAEKKVARIAWLRTAALIADYRCDLPRAMTHWRAIADEDPLDLGAQRAVTRLLGELESRSTALAHLRAVCERFPHHIGLHELWVEWAHGEGLAEVERVLRHLLTLHPEHAWAHRELALVLSSANRFDEAAAALETAATLEPHLPVTAGLRARIALRAHRLEEAREAARAAIRLSIDYDSAIHDLLAASPSHAEKRAAIEFLRSELVWQVIFGDGLLAFRTVAFEIIEPPELLAALRQALAARPDLWHAWSAVVLQLIDMQQLDEALSLAQQATERFPLLPRLWLDLAQVHRLRRERELEIPPLRRALQLSPAWSKASQALADVHQRMGDYTEAARVIEQAIAAAPLHPYNYGCLADVLHHLGRDAEAAARLEHALKLEPGYDWAWDALRAWSPARGAQNRATLLARELTTLRPGEARSWYVLAQSLADAPIAERLEALDRATTLGPRFTDAHDLRAVVLTEAQRYDEAIAACAPPAYGQEVPVYLRGRAAWVEAQRGHPRAAITRMRAVVAAAPDYYWGWNMITDWCCNDGDFAGAEEAAKRMARLAPRSAIPLGYLADIQIRTGQQADAYASLQRAYDLDPTYGFAGYKLFDWHLAEGRLDEAARLLSLLTTHLPGPRTTATSVRLQARRTDQAAAFTALRPLLSVPEENTASLHAAVAALVEAGWSRAAEDALAGALHLVDSNPAVGDLWVRRFVARGAWGQSRRFREAVSNSAVWTQARVAYVEELAHHRRPWRLWWFVRRERAQLASEPLTWGAVGYAYVTLRQWKRALRWMANWRSRPDLQPWMLTNIAAALRSLGRDPEALAANHRALLLAEGHAVAQHHLWLGLDAAFAGRLEEVEKHLAEIREPALGAYEVALLALVKAARAVPTAAPEQRRATYLEHRADLTRRARTGAFAEGALQRSYRRTLTFLAKRAGDRWSWIRDLLPSYHSGGASGTSTATWSWLAIFLGVVLSAVLRECGRTSPPSPPPAALHVFTPRPAVVRPLPTPPRPVIIQLGPGDLAPPPPLLTPTTPRP